MPYKLGRIAMLGVVAVPMLSPLAGCGLTSQPAAVVDTSTPIKEPAAPTIEKVEIKPKPKLRGRR